MQSNEYKLVCSCCNEVINVESLSNFPMNVEGKQTMGKQKQTEEIPSKKLKEPDISIGGLEKTGIFGHKIDLNKLSNLK